jgi:hypothetical protein
MLGFFFVRWFCTRRASFLPVAGTTVLRLAVFKTVASAQAGAACCG